MLMNSFLKPSLLYVVNGQTVAKNKGEQKLIEGGRFYNSEGWLLNEKIKENVYCLSSEVIFVLIDKQMLQENFKATTFNNIMKLALKDIDSKYKISDESKQKEGDKNAEMWNMFKKYPDREIIPLPKKANQNAPKPVKLNSQKDK